MLERKLKINLFVSKFMFLTAAILNLAAPLQMGVFFNRNIFQFIVLAIWLYALLAHLGYFKTEIGVSAVGNKQYEFKIPILPLGLARILEIGYFALFKNGSTNWYALLSLIVLDIIFVIFLILDKARYCYESEEIQND